MTGGKLSNWSQVHDELLSFSVTAWFIWPRWGWRRQAGSFLIPFSIISAAISQSCREQGRSGSASINGLLGPPSLCYFKPLFFFWDLRFWRSGVLLEPFVCVPPWVVEGQQLRLKGKQQPHLSSQLVQCRIQMCWAELTQEHFFIILNTDY